MIIGYFLFEVYLWGISGALVEVPLNIVQITIGGVVGIPVALVVRKRFSDIIV